MALEEYRRKRDFRRTPEPRGGEGVATAALPAVRPVEFPGWSALPAGRRFCVQMHRATRLHWDLRLEHDGVLLSWAVPRGPTLDPAEKRLAVHVEDHPIEYGEFEGVIPSGYGAGTVMLWDAGAVRWEPETAADVAGALRKGDVKFSLEGVKLRGEFALVRIGARGRRRTAPPTAEEDKNWLLIKKRDAAAVPGMDAADLEVSVKTGRDMAQIRADGPPTAREPAADGLRRILESAPQAALPSDCKPMLATPFARAFSRPDWVYEMKYDGVRVLARAQAGRVGLRGRSGRDETARYPEVAAALAGGLAVDEALLDGEIVALDSEGRPSFERLQQRINIGDARQVERMAALVPVTYVVFDVLAAAGRDLRGQPLEVRKRALRLLVHDAPAVRYADHVAAEGEALFEAIRERGVEGMVAKRASSLYEAGRRSTAWLKIKAWNHQDCVICGYTSGRGTRGALGALVLGVYVDGRLTHAGQVGSGLGGAAADELLARLAASRVEQSPLDPVPVTDQPATWVRPELVCSVRFSDWTQAGTMRHPTYRGLRPDLVPADCVREAPASSQVVDAGPVIAASPPAAEDEDGASQHGAVAASSSGARRRRSSRRSGHKQANPLELAPDTTDALRRLATMGNEGRWQIGGRELKLTNLDKPLWPRVTKRAMIDYYVRMSPVLLPYLRDRPLGMQVFPDGIDGKHFWRKRIPDHAPSWIRTFEWRSDTSVTYVVVDEVATLGWLANSAVIDLHPWHSRVDAPEQPDWAVFDLDPFPPATFADVVLVAKLVKAALDHYSLRSFAKLSGQTGMQVYMPVRRGPDYAQVRRFVEEVSRAIGKVIPDKVSWEWEVAKRTGRLRLDYTQNIIGKTLAAPYSLRPAPGAPVSAPIAWEELDDPELRPDLFTIETIAARVTEVGDLFTGVLQGDQDLPAVS
jgi:bifunctional non-homologous end joining protein LigD